MAKHQDHQQFEIVRVPASDATVKNRTGRPIRVVTVVHERGGSRATAAWRALAPGEARGGMQVPSGTGFRVTGDDGWIVAWADTSGGRLTVSCPSNRRRPPDALESAASKFRGVVDRAVDDGRPGCDEVCELLIAALNRCEGTALETPMPTARHGSFSSSAPWSGTLTPAPR